MAPSNQLRHVVRRLGKTPLFTAITLVTLAVGIGANTAIFSVVRGVLLKPLPYPDPDKLVGVWMNAPGLGWKGVNASPASYFTFREENRTFQDVGLWDPDSVSVIGLGEPEQVDGLRVTDGTFPILGVRPILGRTFTRKDDSPGSPETVMLSYGYWQKRFGGSASAIGRRIVADGKAREIIGVLPPDFRFMNLKPALVAPFRLNRNEVFIGNFSYQAIARLKPGATIAQANADVARMIPLMAEKFKPAPGMTLEMFKSARLGPEVHPMMQDVVGNVGSVLWVLMGVVGVVLFIACANVANLLLVRAEGRQQEFAIRAALGAGWSQIARELLLESVALGLVGGALGIGLAYAGLRFLVALGPANLPRLDELSMDVPVLLFTLAVSVLAGVFFGSFAILKYARPSGTALREGGRTLSEGRERHRARGMLVVVQVALALVLLISSGLMIRTFQAMRSVQPGFTAPDKILTFRLYIPETQVPDAERAARMYGDTLERVASVPGVISAGIANSITMDGHSDNDPIFAEDRPDSSGRLPPLRRFKFISPQMFKTMGNPLLAGRDFTWTDIYEKRPVVLVSENFAREYWHSPAAALGKRIHEQPKGPWREIIGVVGDERDDGVDQKAPKIVYWPILIKDFWTQPLILQRGVAVAVRSARTGSSGFLDEMRRAIWSVNPNVPLAEVRTMQQIYDKSMARTSFTLVMLAIAAGMALLLGIVGIYGVTSYSVSQRTREIGIRMALGAQHGSVQRMFVRHGLLLTCIGVVCGLGAAVAVTRLMAALLFGISPLDPMTYCAVPVVLVAAALVASYVPSRRATLIDPVEALRVE
ncbi:MAG: ABC transporter permease [Acidobacteriaceae bacterium]|nr:ABC transporter permease [Acidobacteriaceae bacterium]MBV9778497.1 ABC transporter permease [Acidobacteriaceae bacterium]